MDWTGTIVGGCLGFAAAIAPTIIDIIKSTFDHKQALERNQQSIDAAAAGITAAIDANTMAVRALAVQPDCPSVLDKCVEFIRSTVRPVITYLFFGLFLLVKTTGLVKGLFWEHISVITLLPALWDTETSSLFAAVISFWFGSRSVKRIKGE
jgi:hypothetical protein